MIGLGLEADDKDLNFIPGIANRSHRKSLAVVYLRRPSLRKNLSSTCHTTPAIMIILDNSTQLSHSTNPFNERRASTTSSLPSYETVIPAGHTPAITSDEKKPYDEPLDRSYSNVSSIPYTEGKEVYTKLPPAFSRIPAVNAQSLQVFSPMDIPISGSAKSLDKGLPSGLPQTSEAWHPFNQRDISEDDWNRFIQDLRDGTAVPKCLGTKVLVPATIGMGPGAYFLNKAIKAKVRAKKLKYAVSLINTWNHSFFVPRRVQVVLMRGEKLLTTTVESMAESQKLTSGNNHSSDSVSEDVGSTSKGHLCCKKSQIPLKLVVIPIA